MQNYIIGAWYVLCITERASYHPNWLKKVYYGGTLNHVDLVAGTATIQNPKWGPITGSIEDLKQPAARKSK